ncbi:unnamed protein product [Oreochromis niloticus]|nr:unnamed protein product [Mustela putorius furo]
MAEAGRRVQPNVGRTTVSSIIQTFRRENRTARQPRRGGRGPLLTPQQEERICAMVAANNALRLREIQRTVVEDDTIFGNIQSISISTIDRVLRRNEMSMKQLYKVPFERNSDRVKELRHQYVQQLWMQLVMTSQQSPAEGGFDTPEDTFPDALIELTFAVMLMQICGQTDGSA